MKAGSSVALSGITGGSSAVALDPLVRPFVEAFAAWLTTHSINAGDPFVHAATGAIVVLAGTLGMWLRIRVLAQE